MQFFLEISDHSTSMRNESEVGNVSYNISNDEIITMCKDYGNTSCVLDKVFYMLSSKEELSLKNKLASALIVCKFYIFWVWLRVRVRVYNGL